jgi:chemotaxis protein CheY-P-specific phosphatase CheC
MLRANRAKCHQSGRTIDVTSSLTPPLTDIERDALAELSNIAMARAANGLRQMVENQVLLSVPSVDIVSHGNARVLKTPLPQTWCQNARGLRH